MEVYQVLKCFDRKEGVVPCDVVLSCQPQTFDGFSFADREDLKIQLLNCFFILAILRAQNVISVDHGVSASLRSHFLEAFNLFSSQSFNRKTFSIFSN